MVHPCNGAPECSNLDELPVNADGLYDPFGSGNNGAASLRASLAALVSLVAAFAFLLF